MLESPMRTSRSEGVAPVQAPPPAVAPAQRAQSSSSHPAAGPSPDRNPPLPPARGHGSVVWRLLMLLIVAGAIGGAVWYHVHERKEAKPFLTLQGNIDVRQVNLGFKVDGRIESLAFDEGDKVEAGQVLGTLDARYFDDDLRLARARRDNQKAVLERLEHGSRPEEISEARAALAERQAALENARQALKRRQALVQRGSVTREEYDNARAAFDEAEARMQTAQQALRLAEIGPRREDIDAARAQLRAEEVAVSQSERRLADSHLIAPGSGIILTRAREVGAIVQPGETVFTLTLTSPVWVRTYVSEPDLGQAEPGRVVDVLTDSRRGRVYRGRVGFVSPTAEFTPKTVETTELRTQLVYRVRVVVDDPDGGLRQGMPVTVRLPLAAGASKR